MQVCNYEEENGEIILDNSIAVSNGHKSDNVNACRQYANLISPSYVEMMKLKAFLVVRLIGEKIGPEILIQVSFINGLGYRLKKYVVSYLAFESSNLSTKFSNYLIFGNITKYCSLLQFL